MHLRLACTAALFAAAAFAQDAPPPRHLVLVHTTGPAQLQALQALDLDLAGCQPPLLAQRRVEVIVDDRELAMLVAQGFTVRVVQRDLSAWYAAQAAQHPSSDGPNPPLGQGAMGGHWTLAQMESILDAMHVQNPAICSQKVSIGNSVENRPIWMVKISDHVGVDENEPEVLFDALHHAREPLSMAATVVFMQWLVDNYGTDPDATLIVDERELYFVPCLNPDGYEYNRSIAPGGGGMWRKNRRNNGNGTFGVDLNRNYATAWNAPNGGSSATSSSDTYRGPSAFSEPETQAIEAFAQSRQFVTVFSTHTYTDVLLRPYGWQNGDPANVADYQTLGAYYTVENAVAHGSISSLLYIASGSAADHHHTVRGAYAWTPELGRSNEGGFWPSGQAIVDIVERHQPMFRKVALSAGANFVVAGVVTTEAPGGNGNGTVEAGESGAIAVTIDNLGLSPAAATLVLTSTTPGITIGVGSGTTGPIARLTPGTTMAPLTFAVAAGTTAPIAQFSLLVSGDGRSKARDFTVDLVALQLVVQDDFERDRGFTRGPGTATTGLWERAVPQPTSNGGTTIQPGTQTTPGGSRCMVTDGRGGAAGTYDVDGGYTDLLSPVLDLAHAARAEVRLQYWYAESVGNDAMEVAISRDGGTSWQTVWTRSTSTVAWTPLAIDLGTPLTAQMQVRVRAQDLAASLVECLVDDFEVWGAVPHGAITLLTSGGLATTVQAAMRANPGELCFAIASLATGPGQAYPGVGGLLWLDPTLALVRPFEVAAADGRAVSEFALPASGAFQGIVFHWQAAVFGAAGASFGPNRTATTLR